MDKKPILFVAQNDHGQRLDNFLFKSRKHLDRTAWYKLIRKGQVRVNGKRVKPLHKLQSGDEVRIPPFVYFVALNELAVPKEKQESLLKSILFEDENYLLINKSAGLPVHKGTGFDYGVIELFNSIEQYQQVQLAHRLDKDTSGCLLMAKNRQALLDFQAAMKQQQVQKTYTVVLQGVLEKGVTVEKALNTGNRINGIRTVVIDDNGQSAITQFTPIKSANNLTLCSCQITHGRTHQIRVHAQFLGYPVLGDSIYGEKNDRLSRALYLHASQLRFSNYQFKSDMPPEFSALFA